MILRTRVFARVCCVALTLVAMAPVSVALPPIFDPTPFEDGALVNGGFLACSPEEASLTAYAPPQLAGKTACAGWFARRGLAGANGVVPVSVSEGVLLGFGGHAGTLRVAYDAADGTLLVEQPLALDPVTVWLDPSEARFSYHATARATLGFHLTVDDGATTHRLAGAGTPFTAAVDGQWHEVRFALPAHVGRVATFAIEIQGGTPDGAVLDFDDAKLLGATPAVRHD